MPPTISLSVDPTIVEGNSGTTFLHAFVTLSEPAPAGGLFVQLSTQDGTASSVGDADFQAQSVGITFLAGAAGPADILIPITGDGIFEPDETFSIHLSGATNGTVQNGDATVTILNNDAPLIATLSVSPTIVEGTGGTRFLQAEVTLSRPAPVSGSFTLATVDGTASSVGGADFQAQNVGVTFLAGATGPATFLIPITTDAILEPNETFSIHLTNTNLVDGFANNDAVVTILNDEADPIPPVLALPADITTKATSAAGAAVAFSALATDNVDLTDPVILTDGATIVHSGDTFSIGTHTITATTADAAGNTATGSFTIKVTPPDPLKNDFDSDGHSDILWQNTDGTPVVWLTNGTNLISASNVGFNPGAAWHEIGAGDFNGDGKADILWQNTDGTVAEWFMDGTSLISGASIAFNPGPSWHAIGSGDFNGDGKSDILWQNADGTPAVWLMDGLNIQSGANVGFNPGPAWHVIGSGDFNGDGKSDILWQNKDGTVAEWLMDGTSLISGASVAFNPGPSWHAIGTGDFNADGKADLLWQNLDGTPAVWLMNGTSIISGANVGFNPGPAWQVHGTGDFNADGKSDILWQNTDGTPAVWLMDGTNLISGANVGFNPGSELHVIPQHHDLF
jgi:hypothetical protein